MGGHHHFSTGGNTGLEGDHLAVVNLLPGFAGHGIAEVGIGGGVPVPREMLEAANDARLLQALEIGLHHRCGRLGIVGKSAVADDDVTGVGIDIGHRGEVDVKAVLRKIRADGGGGILDVLGSAGGRQFVHIGELGHAEVWIVGQAGHHAAFLVHAQERIGRQGFQIPDELRELNGVLDVVGKEDNAPHGTFGSRFLHTVAHLLDADGLQFLGGIVV